MIGVGAGAVGGDLAHGMGHCVACIDVGHEAFSIGVSSLLDIWKFIQHEDREIWGSLQQITFL